MPTLLSVVVGLAMLGGGGLALSWPIRWLKAAEAEAGLQMDVKSPDAAGDVLMEQLSFFMLGGLRSLAAEILVLDATNAWVEQDWPRAERRWQAITMLCPTRENYWINASREMALNAVGHIWRNSLLSPTEQAELAYRYRMRGVRFLTDGIAHNPSSAVLYMNLGDLHANLARQPSFEKAAAAYHRAVELGATSLYRRQEFYSLCRIRGREREAWELGRRLYDTPGQRQPSLKCLLFVLQHKIDVPQAERLSPEQLFGSAAQARIELSRFARNQLRFPTTGITSYLAAEE